MPCLFFLPHIDSNICRFFFDWQNDIKPDIEKIENKEGGKFVLRIKGDPDGILIDRCWTWLVLALVGESIEDDDDFISGAGKPSEDTFLLQDDLES